jgi:2'-5' RNA ligase
VVEARAASARGSDAWLYLPVTCLLHWKQMDGCNGAGRGLNSFALVSYLPDPLGSFLDRLRRELAPECHAKAHVTVLPPRPIFRPLQEAWRELERGLQDFPPFRLELAKVQVFPVTNVIYLSVGLGGQVLERMHTALNRGLFELNEPFEYHPHVTLAQELEPESWAAAAELAERRWRDFAHPRLFTVDQLTFVQNTLENRWKDLAGCSLSSHSNISI